MVKTDPDFISVGIGPLHYSSNYIESGMPNDRLSPDIKFIAEQMNLKCPPLPIAHPHEKKIFSDYYGNHPNSTEANRKELAKIFLQKANCTSIFPKLPSMIKAYENKWKKSCLIKLAQTQMAEQYDSLLAHLSTPVSTLQNEVSTNGNMDLVNNVRQEAANELRISFPSINDHPSDENVQNDQTINDVSTSMSGKQLRKCANYPICTSLAKDCGGWKRRYCAFYKNGELDMPDNDTFISLKREHKKSTFRVHMQNKRKKS